LRERKNRRGRLISKVHRRPGLELYSETFRVFRSEGACVQTPRRVWSMEARPDCRRFVCSGCLRACYICSWCDHGHVYCSPACSTSGRSASVRQAGRRYQRTRRGRRHHAQRQARYRDRSASSEGKKVTHQGYPPKAVSATVRGCKAEPFRPPVVAVTAPLPAPPPVEPHMMRCYVCLQACEPQVRHDFLRSRRRHRSGAERRCDHARASRRDPSSSSGRGLA